MRRATTNALWVTVGDVGARALGFVAVLHVTSVLGPSYFGIVTLGLAILTYALWLVDLGLNTLGIREAARARADRRFPLANFVKLELLLAAAVFLLGETLLALLPLDPLARSVVRIYIWYVFSYALLIDWYHQGIRNYAAVTVSKFIFGVLYTGGVYLLVQDRSDVALVPAVHLVANLGAVVWLWSVAHREDFVPTPSARRSYSLMLKQSVPIGLGGLLAQGIQALPPLAVAAFGATADVGVLGTVLRIATTLMMADRVFIALFLPIVARMWSDRHESLGDVLESVLRGISLASFSLSVVITLFARPIVALLFGEAYLAGASALALLAWYPSVTLLNSYFAYSMIAVGRERSYLRASAVSAGISAMLILVFTYLWGLIGVAAAIVIGESAMTIAMGREFRKNFSVRIAVPLMLAFGLAAAVICAGILLSLDRLWQAPIVWLAFASLAVLFRGVTRTDIDLLFRR